MERQAQTEQRSPSYIKDFWSLGDPGSIPGRGELCAPADPQPMNQNERLVLHFKDLIYMFGG